jgi:hypothetical protein
MNAVVSRRLALIPDATLRESLADRFAQGEPISKLAAEAGISTTKAAYSLRQDLVNRDALPANLPSEPGDAWMACILGITPQSIAKERHALAAKIG